VPYSYVQYTGTGTAPLLSVPFPYLLKSHVHIYIGYNLLTDTFQSELIDGAAFTWVSATQVQLSTIAAGTLLTIIRKTPTSTRLVDWNDASNLLAGDMDTADLQNLYAVQEQQDRVVQAAAVANAANEAISDVLLYAPIANVASIPGSPANGDRIELTDSTGIESFSPLAGRPAGFVGSNQLRVRMYWNSASNTWIWESYWTTDSDGRYVRQSSISNSVNSTSQTTVASSLAVKTAKDAADAAAAAATAASAAAAAAQATADAPITTSKLADGAVTTPKLEDGALAASAAGLLKMADGFFTATAGALAKFADGFLAASAAGRAKMADGFVNTAKLEDGAVTTAKLASGITPTVASLNGGQLAGMRNRLINGRMATDQRNAGAAQTITAGAALAYSVDRWYAYCTGANVTGQQVQGASAGQFRYRFTGAASVTGVGFGQRIEQLNSADLAGATATLSADLANSLLTTVTWTAYYANTADSFGTLASPTRTQIATGTFTVTSTITRYSASISVPAAATTGIEIVFSVGAQTSGTWTIGNVQLEAGTVATPFERRSHGLELALCQRYFEQSYADGVAPGTANAGGSVNESTFGDSAAQHTTTFEFKVPKRATPSVSVYNPFSGASPQAYVYAGSYIGIAAVSGIGATPTRVSITTGVYSTSAGSARIFHYTASSEL